MKLLESKNFLPLGGELGNRQYTGFLTLLVLASIDRLTESAADLHARITAWHKTCEASKRLEQIPGVGVLTATYLAAMLGDGSAYRSGRQFSASLGLVPRQLSTGGKQKLGGITKKGDWTLRSLLCEGAISVLRHRLRDSGRHFPGTTRRLEQKSMKSVAVELANRNARTAWAMIRHGADSDPARQHLAKEPMALAA
ncbi:MAG: transposase [Gammaproteobacteria bacterium]|nr:transposase [Gammaproteobacteria bacterium]